jgi:hypothetical protein
MSFSPRNLNLSLIVYFFFKFPDLFGVVNNVKALLLKHIAKGACVTKEYLKICQEGKRFENLTCLEALFL